MATPRKIALALVTCLAVLTGAWSLVWDHPGGDGIVFNVYTKTNLTEPHWRFVATVPVRVFRFSADLPAQFFAVTASNTISGLESSLPGQ